MNDGSQRQSASWDKRLAISEVSSETPSGPPAPAPEIEGYQILGKLGEAGQGQVWRAIQLSTQRQVALKVPRIGLLSYEKVLARFEREVALAARLKHPHIARIVDSGIRRGLYYYAMDLIEGVHLDQYVKDKGLSQRQILELMRVVCEAVRDAHDSGIIHRDLKPSNIIVTKEGHPYVVDFGLAKGMEDAGPTTTVSIEGQATGTPAYMSPEQAAGHLDKVDARTDVYSLGTVLFTLLTGQYPHDLSGSHLEVLHRISQEEVVRPRMLNPHIDRNLEALVLKALHRDPDHRYPSAGELAEDIDNYLKSLPLSTRPRYRVQSVTRLLRQRWLAIAAVGAGAVVLLVGLHTILTISRTRAEPTPNTGLSARQRMDLGPVSAPVPTQGLIVHWALDESAGDVASDSAGVYHGLLHGNPKWIPNGGKTGGAIEFDGVDDYVDIPNAGIADLQQFTIAFWVKPKNLSSNRIQQFVGLSLQRAVVRHDGVHTPGGRQLHFFIRKPDGTFGDVRVNEVLKEGVFQHVAATYDGSVMRLYFNGRLLSGSVQGVPVVAQETDFVLLSGMFPEVLEGLLDEVRIYDRALGDDEIMAVMTARAPRLLAHWAFDESVGNIAHDSIGRHNGILVGGPVWVPDGGRIRGALEFDGVDDRVNVDSAGVNDLQRFTIALWTRIHSLAEGRIQRFITIADEKIVLRIGEDEPGKRQLHFYVTKADGTWGEICVDNAVELGVFHHFAATYDGTTMRLYRDGQLLSSSYEGTALVHGSGDRVDFSGQETFHGHLDDVRIYDEALSRSQIRVLMGPPIPRLVAHWTLDELSGDVAHDNTGNYQGRLFGDPAWLPGGGIVGGALEFDGVDDYVDTGYTDDLPTWTVSTWVNSPTGPAAGAPAGPVHRNHNYQINWDHDDPNLRGTAAVNVGGTWYVATFGPLKGSTWHHLVATYDGKALRAYKDGLLATTNNAPVGDPTPEAASLKLGGHAQAPQHFKGAIDDVRIYNYALSADEVQALHACAGPGPVPRPK
ncbi:MAG: LamG-like jellyroll fold domain-containing protein [Phycisphaerales bacterium]